RLEKAQINVMERDKLPQSNLISTESYFEEEETGEVNDSVSTDSERLNINVALKTLRLLKDYPTRWSSTYRSWKRLLKLKDAIIWLEANLKISRNSDDKKDGQNLAQCLPDEDEWRLIEELVKVFKPFDQATEAFSAEKYPTLSDDFNEEYELDNITDATPIQSISSTSTTSTNRYFASIFDNNDDDNLLNNKSG
ncbi:13190_t:CDS:2, partial [Cetraspora pellucida]